jgi:enamine deaminase RidA (YjgF/YER057c/UK114 family)
MRIMNERYARRFEFGNTPGRATIEVSDLPEGAHIAYTGVAVRDLSRRKSVRPKNMPPSPTASPCVFAGDTLYCSAKSGFIPGPNGGVYFASTPDQARQTMRNQLDNLEEADMNFDQVVSTTIYLDDLNEASQFDDVYKKYFKGPLPAQTTLQQIKPSDRKPNAEGQYPDLEQMSLIAVRKRPDSSKN